MKLLFFILIFFLLAKFSNAKEIEFENIKFFLPHEHNVHFKKMITGGPEGYQIFEEAYLNIENGVLKNATIIQVGPKVLYVHLKYTEHYSGCGEKKVYFLKKYKKGYSFNCWFARKNYFPPPENVFLKATETGFGVFHSRLPKKISAYLDKNKITVPLMIESSHNFYSYKLQKRMVSISYYQDSSHYIEKKIITPFFLNKDIPLNYSYNKSAEDNKNIDKLSEALSDKQQIFEKNLNMDNKYKHTYDKKIINNNQQKLKTIDKLLEIERMYKEGLINDKEFNNLKNKILN